MTRRKDPGVREPWLPATATTEEEALRFAQGQASGGTECSGMHNGIVAKTYETASHCV